MVTSITGTALIVFAFMLVNSKAGGRNGFIVYVLVLVGCQPSLFEKIEAFRKGVVGSSNTEEVVETPPTKKKNRKTKK